MKRIVVISLLLLFSCTHNKKFKKSISEGRCEEAADHLPAIKNENIYKQSLKSGVGHLVSYSATVAGAAVDTALLTASVAGVVTLTCPLFPIFVLALLDGKNVSGIDVRCFDRPLIPIKVHTDFYAGDIYDATESVRCVNLTELSKSLREVAHCYEKREGADNYAKSKEQLERLIHHDSYYKCLDVDEQDSLDGQYQQLGEKMFNRGTGSLIIL